MDQGRIEIEPFVVRGEYFKSLADGRVVCELCPRACTLSEGQRGFCFVREARNQEMVLTTYGRSTGFCIDPIEKKPLNHFYPGTGVLSFGTAGCNLGCLFCQNWEMSKARELDRRLDAAAPDAIADAACRTGATAVAFTYNDPVVFHEYAIDTAQACHQRDIKTVAVTAGYITSAARARFFAPMDAANIDLKAFSEEFYQRQCAAHLQPVLETLRYVARETNVWLEVTTLLIPDENDSDDELARLCDWYLRELGPNVPLHFTVFHPDFRLLDRSPTPAETLLRARARAQAAGLHYVYTGNLSDPNGQSTYCPACRARVIERDGYTLGDWQLRAGVCAACGATIAGHFAPVAGTWGARRLPIRWHR